VLGYGWLRPTGLAGSLWLTVAAALVALAFAGSLAALKGSRVVFVFAAVLGIQIVHSILYEPESIERWDMPAMLFGLLGSMAIIELRRKEEWKAVRWLSVLWGPLRPCCSA